MHNQATNATSVNSLETYEDSYTLPLGILDWLRNVQHYLRVCESTVIDKAHV